MKLLSATLIGAAAFIVSPGLTTATMLYDASLGSTPRSQGWTYPTDPRPGSSTTGVSGGLLSLNTTAVKSDVAGYLRTSTIFDNSGKYSVEIKAKIISENHTPSDKNNDGIDDRAGFSLIVVGNDYRGIELGFWTDRVWVQADHPLFVQAEHVAINTTLAIVDYLLTFSAGQYSLSADNVPILSGPMRNYSSFGLPYSFPNVIFFGDDTASASANAQIANIAFTVLPVPEPAAAVLVAGAALCLMAAHTVKRVRRRAPL